MHHAESILVIIVSATLTFFLLVLIAVLTLLARVLLSVKRLVQQAENVVEAAESITETFKEASGPVALYRSVRKIMKIVKRKGK